MFDTHFATEVRETSGLVPIVGALGSGKSVLAGLITYEAVRRGITSVMLDPSGRWPGSPNSRNCATSPGTST
jgi:type IV secretory pathway VirB4 component